MVISSDEMEAKLLHYALKRQKVPDYHYSLNGNGEECMCMAKVGNEWLVYYNERGKKTLHGTFNKHINAARFFYWMLVQSPGFHDYREEFEEQFNQAV